MRKMKIKEFTEILKNIMKRYDQFSRYLNYPGEWGERAFRGWVVFEILHDFLGWSGENIVFGEKYDVLMVDDDVKPVIYLETKKPGRGLADIEDFRGRLSNYPTLEYAILANGYEWLRLDMIKNKELKISLNDEPTKWRAFLKPLHASNYLYGVKA